MAIMNDEISKMTEKEITDACLSLVGYPACVQPLYPYHNLVGLIIAKLQEWDFYIQWLPKYRQWEVSNGLVKGYSFDNSSLQVAFLEAAHALGHWTPPQKVKEEPTTLEERVDALEAKMRVLLPSYGAGNLHTKPQETPRVI